MLTFFQHITFKTSQLKHSRVEQAYADKEKILQKYFTDKNLDMKNMVLRILISGKIFNSFIWILKAQGNCDPSLLIQRVLTSLIQIKPELILLRNK